MKISYNWLKQYCNVNYGPSQVAQLLTDCGLEVESMEEIQSVKGGLKGLVIGEVKTKVKHPNADKLSVTTVDTGTGTELQIVCGASNVDVGQKVVVATVGTILYSSVSPSALGQDGVRQFEIKKSKIRGELSEGMLCAEDEIGLGASHEGIMVLPADAKAGTPAKEYFNVEEDTVFEIGLTPNRVDAASHIGVARDLNAVLNCKLQVAGRGLLIPDTENFAVDNHDGKIEVVVEDTESCPRYSGLIITEVEVKESPQWLQNRLKAIGQKPINNVVDITNYVLYECGQPLHAFDANKIKGKKVIVKKLQTGTKFTTLEGTERELTADDLMICNAEAGMCIAGVFGGIDSGVGFETKNIFLESAYFSPETIRRTAKHHGLKTDAAFRFERGTDPNNTVYALKRAALLLKEIAGGTISSEIIDIYPKPVRNFEISFSYLNAERLLGIAIEKNTVKNILTLLGITILKETEVELLLSVPPFKVDVQREADVMEEILRIYGYNNVPIPNKLNSSLSFSLEQDKEKIQNTIADYLSSCGFYEIMSNSLTKEIYAESINLKKEENVTILNPLSSDLNVMRQTLLFSGLDAIAYNKNRKHADLKMYEFGKTYQKKSQITNHKSQSPASNPQSPIPNFTETSHLALFVTGRKNPEGWNGSNENVNFYFLKSFVQNILNRLGITHLITWNELREHAVFSEGLVGCSSDNKSIVEFGEVKNSLLKLLDINQGVFYADFNWTLLLESLKNQKVRYKEVSKFPEVQRDLALLLDKAVSYAELEKSAYETERELLKAVNLFDVYEGEKIEAGKKSYALRFILQDEHKTLTDKQIDKVMERLMDVFQKKNGAVVRKG